MGHFRGFITQNVLNVNFLNKDQRDICTLFAGKAANKFASVEYRLSKMGLPMLAGAVSCINCEATKIIPSGDHEIIIGDVHDIEHFGGDPLVHFKRSFHTTAACG